MIDRLHGEIVAAARNPILFTDYAIEDNFEGRFEAVTLHAALVLRRLNAMPRPGPELAQDLIDAVFRHFDIALRETGIGDIAVPKRMKTLAEAFLGRGAAYDRALTSGEEVLAATLARNVYADRTNAIRLSRYVKATDRALETAQLEVFSIGPVPFPEPSAIA
ncbi:ubiquinol-cytochrome C chaperone family protein [Methylocapsa acidiphila]|uniref:ubiquinol-cytochrome C chaperone family protein n=1 Tax=Methylocapsa acidiphila TaxID=133552 RepID=UPI001FDA6BE7|nr:ubiquinol-cytochrome C chaperone family protein [Methylocapsa acidiphila]